MRLLITHSPATLQAFFGQNVYAENLGLLMSPRRLQPMPDGIIWAADNDAYSGFNEVNYRNMLARIVEFPSPLFVTAPDVVADAEATLDAFDLWQPELHALALPVALVAQDGLERLHVPWDRFEALFIGGSTGWKLGQDAAALIREAKARGKWVHMGRCNSNRRLHYARSLACDSADGSGYARFAKLRLPKALPALRSHTERMEGF